MADYFQHWLDVGEKADSTKLPKIYYVNWFRKDSDGRFLWPGFGENCRILKWIFERCNGKADANKTAIGYLPTEAALDLTGLQLDPDALHELLTINPEAWHHEVEQLEEYYKMYGEQLPDGIRRQLDQLKARLQ